MWSCQFGAASSRLSGLSSGPAESSESETRKKIRKQEGLYPVRHLTKQEKSHWEQIYLGRKVDKSFMLLQKQIADLHTPTCSKALLCKWKRDVRLGLRLRPDLLTLTTDKFLTFICSLKTSPEFTCVDYFTSSYTQVYSLTSPHLRVAPQSFPPFLISILYCVNCFVEIVLLFQKTSYTPQVALGTTPWWKNKH